MKQHSAQHDDQLQRELASLRAENSRLKALLAVAPVAIVMLDNYNKIMAWNSAAQVIFGWAAIEVVGSMLPIVPADRRQEYTALDRFVRQGHVLTDIEVRRE